MRECSVGAGGPWLCPLPKIRCATRQEIWMKLALLQPRQILTLSALLEMPTQIYSSQKPCNESPVVSIHTI